MKDIEKNGNVQRSDSQDPLDEALPERDRWGNKAEFYLTMAGYVVGLGNVWRFPYLAFKYGGGSFLLPYFLFTFFIGIPLVTLEMAPAQWSSQGPLNLWSCVPIFRGTGVAAILSMFVVAIPFCTVYLWAWYYLFASLTSKLPWETCDHPWNTPYCFSKKEAWPCEQKNGSIWFNQTCYNQTVLSDPTLNSLINNSTILRTPATKEFFDFRVYNLDKQKNISHMGGLKWDLCLTSLLLWTVTFIAIFKGIKSIGKIVYFTAIFPYVVLIIFLIKGLTLEGAIDGVRYYVTIQPEMLATIWPWAFAASQILFSLAVGVGGIMTFASYNNLQNNIIRDTLYFVLINSLTSFFAGFAVFSILGFMAKDLGVTIAELQIDESALAFITYPEVITRLDPAPFWSCLFFIMLITVAFDSVVTGTEVLQTAIIDSFPRLRHKRIIVAMGLCIFLFIFCLPECTQGGYYLEQLIDWYAVTFSLIVVTFFECIALAYFYGPMRLSNDISLMLGHGITSRMWHYLKWIWIAAWLVICPIALFLVLFVLCFFFAPPDFGGDPLPQWALVIGWLTGVVTILFIPITAIYQFALTYRTSSDLYFEGSVWGRFKSLLGPSKAWPNHHDKSQEGEKSATYDNPAYAETTKF